MSLKSHVSAEGDRQTPLTGYLAAIAPFGIDVWTPAAGAGPRGITLDGDLSPLGHFLTISARLAGSPVRRADVSDPERIAALAAGESLLLANLSDQRVDVTVDGSARLHLDPYGIETRQLGP